MLCTLHKGSARAVKNVRGFDHKGYRPCSSAPPAVERFAHERGGGEKAPGTRGLRRAQSPTQGRQQQRSFAKAAIRPCNVSARERRAGCVLLYFDVFDVRAINLHHTIRRTLRTSMSEAAGGAGAFTAFRRTEKHVETKENKLLPRL